MQLIERKADVVTGSTRLEDLHTLRDFPVFMGSVEHDQSKDLTADMSWSISRDSGLIQLKKLLPLDVLYQAQTTTSAVGALWMKHHREFATFVREYAPKAVLELGGAHGILSVEYQKYQDIPWTILEPNPAPVEGCRARFIKGFFDSKFSLKESIDTVIHSHVFEHLYEPAEFVKHLAEFIRDGQYMIFSIPHLAAWLAKMYTNCINFEHSVFLTEPYVEYLLAKFGFRILKKQYVMDGHSIFYATVRDRSVKPIALSPDLYDENKELYLAFVRYHEGLTKELNAKVRAYAGPVYLFGAHVFAQYLIAFGLDTSKIVSLLDNDKNKQGKRLYGTSLKVHAPAVLRAESTPAVILKAGIYNDEIKADILNNINGKAVFFE